MLVEVLPQALERIQPLYDPLAAAMVRLPRGYSARELAIIVDYISRAADISTEHVAWLSERPPAGRRSRSRRR